MNRLLAKSYDHTEHDDAPPDYALLTQHSRDVAEACDALFDTVGRLVLRNAGLDAGENAFDFASFRLMLRANGWMQDLGKASSHFQRMIGGEFRQPQLVRHETISGLLVMREPLRAWLLTRLPEKMLVAAVWGAIGHHRKFSIDTRPRECPSLTVRVAHQDFKTLLDAMSEDLGLPPAPAFAADLTIARTGKEKCDFPALESLNDLQDEFINLETEFDSDQERRLLALIKGFGIAADVAASAVAERERSGYSLTDFVIKHLCGGGLTADDLTRLINARLPPNSSPRQFQDEVSQAASPLTLVQAGCGSGKSLAAYMWAREWCQRRAQGEDSKTNFRLFFCLPTTGTTTEHFKDYALESGIDESLISLTHSRAGVDLRTMAETADQEEAETDADEIDTAKAARATLNARQDKIESLELWSTPLVVATADTVLGLMANARRAVYSLPAIMSGAIVFDEIHAFDEQMFWHLLVFLKNFPRLPVLLMTASLPGERLRALKTTRPDLDLDRDVIRGPQDFENLERYLVTAATSEEETWDAADACVKEGGKVLWVRNRVEWANEIYEAARLRFPDTAVNVYHSRFRYRDRSDRHRRVIDSFKSETKRAAILVATQVAEMSLDLSADLLITDLAPIPSLIQRMGRLNRRAMPGDPRNTAKRAVVSALPLGVPKVERPYDKPDLERAEEWLRVLMSHQRALSQRDLAEAFARFDNVGDYDLARAEERACFFSGLWQTRPGTLRSDGHTISVILQVDWENWKEQNIDKRRREPERDWIREHEVSIPFKDIALGWERIGTVRVAPASDVEYDFNKKTKEGTGAKWRKP